MGRPGILENHSGKTEDNGRISTMIHNIYYPDIPIALVGEEIMEYTGSICMPIVISKDGTKIAFETAGSGQPVILVDGALCHRTFGPMGPLSKLLAPHFRVFTYDRRGRGESGDTLPYAVEREIEDIQALVYEAGGSAFLYGISSGAALALQAASHLPGIRKLAMYDAPFNNDEYYIRALKDYTGNLTGLLSANRRGDAVELFMKLVGTPPGSVAGMRHSPIWAGFESIAQTLAYDNALLGDGSVPDRVAASVTVPILVMAGTKSPLFMHETAQAIAGAAPRGQYRILMDQTHDVAPEAMAPVTD